MWKTEIYIKSWFELLVTYYDINLINSVKLTYRNVEEQSANNIIRSQI